MSYVIIVFCLFCVQSVPELHSSRKTRIFLLLIRSVGFDLLYFSHSWIVHSEVWLFSFIMGWIIVHSRYVVFFFLFICYDCVLDCWCMVTVASFFNCSDYFVYFFLLSLFSFMNFSFFVSRSLNYCCWCIFLSSFCVEWFFSIGFFFFFHQYEVWKMRALIKKDCDGKPDWFCAIYSVKTNDQSTHHELCRLVSLLC